MEKQILKFDYKDFSKLVKLTEGEKEFLKQRPALGYIINNNGVFVGTDCSIIGVIDSIDYFENNEICLNIFNNTAIHRDTLIAIGKLKKNEFVEWDGEFMYVKGVKHSLLKFDSETFMIEKEFKFPNYTKIVPNYDKCDGILEIGLDSHNLHRLSEAFIGKKTTVKLTFSKNNRRAVKVEPILKMKESKSYGLLTPNMLYE